VRYEDFYTVPHSGQLVTQLNN